MISPESATLKNLFDSAASREDSYRKRASFNSSRANLNRKMISDFRKPKRQSIATVRIENRVNIAQNTPTEVLTKREPTPSIDDEDLKIAVDPKNVDQKSATDTIDPPKETSNRQDGKRKNNIKQVAMWVLILATLLVGAYVTWASFMASKAIDGAVNGQPASSSRGVGGPDSRDETRPDIDGYRVAPDMPRTITIESLGVYARVIPLDTEQSNRLAAPNNIFDTGWYDGSVKPGSGSGAALIDGHRSGMTKAGIFERIGQLNSGDNITIERGDGELISYSVVTKETMPYQDVDMLKALTPIKEGKESLTLISCSGEWDEGANTNVTRDIVYATRIK